MVQKQVLSEEPPHGPATSLLGRTPQKQGLVFKQELACACPQQRCSHGQKVEKPSRPSAEEQTIKTWSTQTAEQPLIRKRNGTVLHATLRKQPKHMLNERRHTPRPHTARLLMNATSRAGRVWRWQADDWWPGAGGGARRGPASQGRVSWSADGASRPDGEVAVQHCECAPRHRMPPGCALINGRFWVM